MAFNLKLDQWVYVPSILLPDGGRDIHAIRRCKIAEVVNRSVCVQLSDGSSSKKIASSKIHTNLGIALVSIGDFASEEGLITPLSKSILQFCRLLVPDDQMTSIKIRAIGELGEWWGKNHPAYTHVILVGHGSREAIHFGVGGARKPKSFERRLGIHHASPKTFISLCCETGRNPFARDFSRLPFCGTLIAPYHTVHGAVASQFLQSFMSLHLLQGKSLGVAFKNASELIPGRESFRLWK
ncbi:hypothetical protein [Acidithiobacillus sp. 'AMD consortium']|uniref:hypothetical protein n=1 Tax=Acidithiobacillus sp. 'AMD consortium' TaxID=2614801 RepID=UPI00178C4674|nr:hypothetical protein [Acidithiobacillus sp. 'AMD consortium']